MADVAVERQAHAASSQGGSVSMSGLTEPQAREFHKAFVSSFMIFLVIAIVAHFLVWQWRPWIPGAAGYEVGSVPTVTVGNSA
jgi:light-harvesting complex 1 beta chain